MKAVQPLDRQVWFVHIPKTAGGTLKNVMANAFGPPQIANGGDYIADPDRARRKAEKLSSGRRIVVGHTPYGLFQHLLAPDAGVMTMLRDPVERVLSHYYSHIHHKNYTTGGRTFTSLANALEARLPHITNLSTRFLCDDPSPDPGEKQLEEAKRTLDRCFFVGIQERFDESVVLLHQALPITEIAPYAERRHANATRPTATDISPMIHNAIKEANRLDRALYAYGCELFDAALTLLGDISGNLATLCQRTAAALEDYEAEQRDAAAWLDRQLRPGMVASFDELAAAAKVAGIAYRPFKQGVHRMRLAGQAVALAPDDTGTLQVMAKEVGFVRLRDIDSPFIRRLADDEISVPVNLPSADTGDD